MAKNIHRRSRRMLEFDQKSEITPPLSPHDLPSTEKINEELHSDIESLSPFESQVGVVETLE